MEEFVYRLAIGLPGFLLAIVFHEWAHAFVALKFGDDTAKQCGRLSFNPSVHYDVIGTVIFPLICAVLGGAMFGWAKPVPVDPRRFRKVKSGIFWVSFAGPLANIILALLSAFLLAFMLTKVSSTFYLYVPFVEILKQSVFINIILAVFNLIPFPPLDGSKMVSTFMDYNMARKYEELQRYSFLFILVLWMTPVLRYVMTPALVAGNSIVSLFINFLG